MFGTGRQTVASNPWYPPASVGWQPGFVMTQPRPRGPRDVYQLSGLGRSWMSHTFHRPPAPAPAPMGGSHWMHFMRHLSPAQAAAYNAQLAAQVAKAKAAQEAWNRQPHFVGGGRVGHMHFMAPMTPPTMLAPPTHRPPVEPGMIHLHWGHHWGGGWNLRNPGQVMPMHPPTLAIPLQTPSIGPGHPFTMPTTPPPPGMGWGWTGHGFAPFPLPPKTPVRPWRGPIDTAMHLGWRRLHRQPLMQAGPAPGVPVGYTLQGGWWRPPPGKSGQWYAGPGLMTPGGTPPAGGWHIPYSQAQQIAANQQAMAQALLQPGEAGTHPVFGAGRTWFHTGAPATGPRRPARTKWHYRRPGASRAHEEFTLTGFGDSMIKGHTPYFQDYTTKLAPFGVPGPIERTAYMSGFGELGIHWKLPTHITGNWLLHTFLPIAGGIAAIGGAYYLGPAGLKALGGHIGTFTSHLFHFFSSSGMSQTAAQAATNAVLNGEQPVPGQVLEGTGPNTPVPGEGAGPSTPSGAAQASMFGGSTMVWLGIGGLGLIALMGMMGGKKGAAPAPIVVMTK